MTVRTNVSRGCNKPNAQVLVVAVLSSDTYLGATSSLDVIILELSFSCCTQKQIFANELLKLLELHASLEEKCSSGRAGI